MLTYLAIGGGLAFAAAIQPGPLQAYLLSRVAAIGWRRTLPAAFAPLLSDGPIALLALLVLGQLTLAMQSVLRLAGGVLLFYLAWRTLRQARGRAEAAPKTERVPRSLLEATLVNLANPNPYLGWALILGPAAVSAWQEAPSYGVAVVASFYVTMVTMLALLIVSFGSAGFLGERGQKILLHVSAWILAGLGAYQIAKASQCFWAS